MTRVARQECEVVLECGGGDQDIEIGDHLAATAEGGSDAREDLHGRVIKTKHGNVAINSLILAISRSGSAAFAAPS